MKKQNKKIDKSKLKKAKRADGWSNVLTGLGVKGMDKRLSAEANWERLPEVDADNLYASDDIAKKIVNTLVDESFREGFNLTGLEKEQADAMMAKYNSFACSTKLARVWKMARQYGGAGGLLLTDDMKDMTKPLSENAFLKGITSLSMWELYAQHEDMDFNILSASYFTPELYTYQPRHTSTESQSFQKIHKSRILRFDGAELSKRFMQQNNYWGDSYLNPLINAIRNYQLSHDAAASVVQDFRIAVFKIKDLADKIGADNDEAIIKRMEIVNLTRSIARSVLIDADGEDFDYKMGTVTGVKDILDKVENRLVGGTNMPRTILLGESPTGLGGSGKHESQNWYDYISSQQENYLKPKLMHIFKMIGRELKIETSNMGIEFNPLWQMDEKETAEVRKLNAESDNIYLTQGVVDSDEVALSRFGGNKYGSEIKIEKSLRVEKPITPEAQNSVTGADDVQKTALNGAQVSSMVEIVQSVATGNLPRESGISMLVKAFNMNEQDADAVMGSAGKGFKPSGTALPGQGGGFRNDGAIKELSQEFEENPELEFADSIEKEGDKWIVYSLSHEKLGEYPTEEQAKERLKQIEMFKQMNDGGPGSGPQGGGGGKSASDHSSEITRATDREKKAEAKIKEIQAATGKNESWWTAPEYTAAAKEYKSAVRDRQKVMREAKKYLAATKGNK